MRTKITLTLTMVLVLIFGIDEKLYSQESEFQYPDRSVTCRSYPDHILCMDR